MTETATTILAAFTVFGAALLGGLLGFQIGRRWAVKSLVEAKRIMNGLMYENESLRHANEESLAWIERVLPLVDKAIAVVDEKVATTKQGDSVH